MSASLYLDGVQLPEELGVNMSNANARAVLAALGLTTAFEDEPMPPAAEMLAACKRFLASEIAAYVDGGTPTIETRHASGGVLIACGRDPGYITMRVEEIKAALEYGIARGADGACFC